MSSNGHIKIALAGIAGYGDRYLEALLPKQELLGVRLVGVVDPQPQRCLRLRELHEQRISIFPSLRSLSASETIDLMMIVTPIHLHASQTCFALERGVNVLCEKPLAGTVADAMRMLDVQQRSSAFAAIGFQWSFSQAIQSLKRDIMEGVLGRPIRLKSLVFFPRPLAYFRRSDWAGRIHMPDGAGVYDSPVNNATAHYLHNMLYILGRTRETSALPLTMQAELYRANEIENYDTAALRCQLEGGVELLFYTSHACEEKRGPRSSYEFENAVVEYDGGASGQFVARFHDGRTHHYGHPNADRNEKIWDAIAAVRTGKPVACGVAAAIPHAMCVAAAQQSGGKIVDFPPRLRHIAPLDDDDMMAVDGLCEQLTDCYERGILPSEDARLAWAQPAKVVDVRPPEPRRPHVTVSVPAASSATSWPSVELH